MSKDFTTGDIVDVTGSTTTTPELPPLALVDDFGDPETLFNSRSWLQKALEDKGAKIIGAGCGGGGADLDIVVEGCRFNVSIRPLIYPGRATQAGEENSA